MKFTRINAHTVNCIITADDMDEQGLSVEDLFHKKDEAMMFLQEIIARASEEVNYKPNGQFLPMQIAVLPDQSVSVTLSEDPGMSIAEMLKGLAERLRQFLEDLSDTGVGANIDVRVGEEDANAKKASSPLLPLLQYSEYVFSFDNLRVVSRFAKTVKGAPPLISNLYKDVAEDRYYLHLTPRNAARFADVADATSAYASLFIHASEYGTFVSVERRYVLHMQETMEIVIQDEALERLASL